VENRYDDDGGSDGNERIEENAMSSSQHPTDAFHRHCLPVRLGCVGCSFQFGLNVLSITAPSNPLPPKTGAHSPASWADLMKLAFPRNALVLFADMFDVIFKFTVALG
jgi:hypothetical protein